jgi:hypothetical protein
MNAIVIGRSNLVGRPLVQLLLNENATVMIAHSRSLDLPKLCAQADLVYAAVGKPEMVRGNWLKPGATVIDVGINRIPTAEGKTKLVGDVAFQEALEVAGAITPVPGGVGQMTVACLLVNTLRAACAIHKLPAPGVLIFTSPRARGAKQSLSESGIVDCFVATLLAMTSVRRHPAAFSISADRTGSCRHTFDARAAHWCRVNASNLPNWRAPARKRKILSVMPV